MRCGDTEIGSAILATRHDGEPTSANSRLVVDCDLWILGSHSDRFREFESQIRNEYRHVSNDAFRVGRSRVLEGFLSRESIYLTDGFAELQAQALLNLQWALDRLAR